MKEPTTRFNGKSTAQQLGWENLPVVNPQALTRPDKYLASDELGAAVNVALTLGMPLLLTGEPGSGKSQLAYRLAWEFGFPNPEYKRQEAQAQGDKYSEPKHKPLRFAVKSTTEARDLFYTFDTVGRFHAAQVRAANSNAGSPENAPEARTPSDSSADAINFIDYQALGLAILRAKGIRGVESELITDHHRKKLTEEPIRSVVLIDEIDKAPRDVPNDILTEIEDMSFTIPELGRKEIRIEGEDQAYRPVVIITSNSERDLPEAFLRRCVYYHLPFPEFDGGDGRVTVRDIVESRMGDRFKDDFLNRALLLFRHVRENQDDLNKPPSMAELLNWLDFLYHEYLDEQARRRIERFNQIPENELIRSVRQTLLKTSEDQQRSAELMDGWQNRKG